MAGDTETLKELISDLNKLLYQELANPESMQSGIGRELKNTIEKAGRVHGFSHSELQHAGHTVTYLLLRLARENPEITKDGRDEGLKIARSVLYDLMLIAKERAYAGFPDFGKFVLSTDEKGDK